MKEYKSHCVRIVIFVQKTDTPPSCYKTFIRICNNSKWHFSLTNDEKGEGAGRRKRKCYVSTVLSRFRGHVSPPLRNSQHVPRNLAPVQFTRPGQLRGEESVTEGHLDFATRVCSAI